MRLGIDKLDYQAFLRSKSFAAESCGFDVDISDLSPHLFPFQADLVRWALAKGRAALFTGCGSGKTAMQLEWAHRIVERGWGRILILAPLAVSHQTVREGAKFGIDVTLCESQADVKLGVNITNYEKLHKFDVSKFGGIVLDESSILKSYSGAIRNAIIEAFKETPYRLACTATPAPNDFMELGNHSEFLGVMSRVEMLATFFVHDGGDTSKWRLKGHADDAFWRWVCGWAAVLNQPSDLGYSDDGFALPPLIAHRHVIQLDQNDAHAAGLLFVPDAMTLQEQRAAKRSSMDRRVALCAELANSNNEPWAVWCDLNDEGDALEKAINGAVQVAGADTDEFKTCAMLGFAEGNHRVMVSKAKIAGWGMNWQHCNNVAFVGVNHSFESVYQTIRRCWRFGQTKPVNVHMILAENEQGILSNLERKEREAERMTAAMLIHMREIQQAAIKGQSRQQDSYINTGKIEVPTWITQ